MKITKLFAAVIISASLTACNSKEVTNPKIEVDTTIKTVMIEKSEKEEISTVETENKVSPAETEGNKETRAEESKTENLAESQPEQKAESVYEDNFAVESSAAKAFAEKIKAAVASKDIEALADLTAFPIYVGVAEGGVETREEFIALGAEKVFTPELIASIEGADISNLLPSMAGFSISKDGKPNIIFGVVEGNLAIRGINYK